MIALKKKTIMIINKINMIKLRMLNIIQNQCEKTTSIFSINASSFEEIFMFMFIKNFY